MDSRELHGYIRLHGLQGYIRLHGLRDYTGLTWTKRLDSRGLHGWFELGLYGWTDIDGTGGWWRGGCSVRYEISAEPETERLVGEIVR